MKLGGPPRDYKVKVQTGTESGAGTDSDIDLTITGTEGHISVRLNPMISGNAFENGDQDTVYLNKYLDIGKLREVKVCSNGRGWGSDWSLKWIEIDDRRVYFNQWLDGRCSSRGDLDYNTIRPHFGFFSCLDVEGADVTKKILLWQCHDGRNQKWLLDSDGFLRTALNRNMCVDIGPNPTQSQRAFSQHL